MERNVYKYNIEVNVIDILSRPIRIEVNDEIENVLDFLSALPREERRVDLSTQEKVIYLEEYVKIIQNSIDILPIIWQNIILEVPLKVVSPDIEVKNINGDGWRFITDEEVVEKEIDPRLEKLKEFLGE